MFYSYPQETLQEVPGEISLALSISGCPLRCKGCHSTDSYKKDFGNELTTTELERLLKKFKHSSCVLFYGGEWDISTLLTMIETVKNKGLKVALYSGFELSFFSKDFLSKIDFIKVGAYKKDLGGLNSKDTNQRFYILKDGDIEKDITTSFNI